MHPSPLIRLGLVMLVALGHGPAAAADELSQAEAQARLQRLKLEIRRLGSELEQRRGALSKEHAALRRADLDIQKTTLEMRELEASKRAHDLELSKLHGQRLTYLDSLGERRDALAQQIIMAYRLGRESRLKLVLNQDSPALLSRTLAYYDYLSRAQASQISELKQVLETLDRMQAKIRAQAAALETVRKSHQAALDTLSAQRVERQAMIDGLSALIESGEAKLVALREDQENLEALLARLSDVLADIPADLGKQLAPRELRGRLPMPVKGRVRNAFGQARTAGLHWQGWLIGAANGSDVKAIAHGRVAYSDWLRGYGLLMIIDHGDGFMSLYGNNESLMHEVGDWVAPGTLIATVGSGSQFGNGLYFEIRKDGKAMDPSIWLKR